MHIRNSVKAIVINEEKMLLTKNQDHEGYFYLCPGGGQEHGETFHETLLRECLEEVGVDVEVGELLFIREYIGKNHEHASVDFNVHQVGYYFACELKDFKEIDGQPSNPDVHQIGVEWIPINDLCQCRFYPNHLKEYIINYLNGEKSPIYLGDVN
ncbi:NUDIX domain-containing protein [Heyndrickxia sp. NPDC080065]|uniref:NUDIX domain-containing protein n=1 Tax=Heyndrickxia sp. NPDC080065 TaxID=3390568 RepID=UPI003D02CF70